MVFQHSAVTHPPAPFGTFKPSAAIQKKIDWCHRLPANWFGKQVAQVLRKQVMRQARMPLDLSFDQVKLRCFLQDNVSERGFVFMPWRFDAIEREVMLSHLAADGVFIDIGANVGIYSAIATTALDQTGVVLAIEPNPPVFKRLQFNVAATTAAMTAAPRVELIQQGISDQCGEFQLYLDADNLGASSLLATANKNTAIMVTCLPLLNLIEAQKLSRTDVIKCDIEGAEDRALVPFLLEAPNALLPQCIIFENNSKQWQMDLMEVLKQRGFHQTHQTRLNVIFQRRQAIKLSTQSKKFSGAIPAASLQCKQPTVQKSPSVRS